MDSDTVEHGDPVYIWSLDEYVFRCEIHDIHEIVAEGSGDRAFYEDTLLRWNLAHVQVCDAASIQIGGEAVSGAGWHNGVKGQLLTLAQALSSRSEQVRNDGGAMRGNVLIVVDRDYDPVIAESASDFAVTTDGYSIENYALTERAFDRFVRMVLGRSVTPQRRQRARAGSRGAEWLTRVLDASADLAAVRLALRDTIPPRKLPSRWEKAIKVDPQGMASVNAKKLLTDSLAPDALDPAIHDLGARKGAVLGDPVLFVRGWDYVEVLLRVLRSAWGRRSAGKNFSNVASAELQRNLLVSIDSSEFDDSRLAKTIRSHFSSSQ